MPDEPTEITIDVLIAHPEPVQRMIIQQLLENQPHVRVVAVTGDGATAALTTQLLRPAVVLIDDRLTSRDAVELLARRSRVILLTGETETQVVGAMLHEPARGYLVYDNFEPADVLGAVRAVARGMAWLSPLAASAAAEELRATAPAPSTPPPTAQSPTAQSPTAQSPAALSPTALPSVTRASVTSTTSARLGPGHTIRFTPREREVLEMLGRGRSVVDIAQALSIRVGTVRGHLRRGFLKLGVTGRAEAVRRLASDPSADRPG